MAQRVGIEGRFDVTQFNTGLKKYISGLDQAVAATNQAALSMQNLGSTSSRTLGNLSQGLRQFGTSANTGLGGASKQLSVLSRALHFNQVSVAAATGNLHGLSVAGIAVGTAIGQTAVQAIQRLGSAVAGLVGQGLELVVFFERLGLSINFFAARSALSEDASLSFADALAQTAQEAQGLLLYVRQLAITSPLTTQQVGNIFRVSQAYGLLADEAQVLLPLLLDLGAATGLDPQTLENAARALGQIRSRGKLTGEEIRQLGNAGIPIRDILVKELEITNQEFDQILESGALLSDLVIPAIVDSLRDFEGAAEKVAFETIGGLLSQLEEIRQIGIADFFKGLLSAIKPLAEALVDFADNPEFLAFLQVIGEELGGALSQGIQKLTEGVKAVIEAWQSLNPEVQRGIIVFIGAGAAITVIIGAMGLLFFAIQALINPFTIIVGLLAASVAAWVQWGDQVVSAVEGTVRGVFRGFEALTGFVENIIQTLFGGLYDPIDFRDAGEGAGEAWSTGFAQGAVSGSARALSTLSSYLIGEMRPGSWPKFLRGLVGSGEGPVESYAAEFETAAKQSTMTEFLRLNIMEGLAPIKKTAAEVGEEDAVAYFGAWGLPSTTELTDFVKPAVEALGNENGEVVQAAYSAGISASAAWVDGFRTLIPIPGDVVNEEIAEIIAKIGGGRQLSLSGAEAFSKFLKGFEQADFGILSDISGDVDTYLSALVNLGNIPDVEVPRTLYDVREAVAGAIKEFRNLGRISESAFRSVRNAAGPVGADVEKLLRLYQDFAEDTNNLVEAQDELNSVTQKYDELLEPLYKRLRDVSNERQTAEEARELAELQRIVNSKIVTDERKRIAAAKIQEILTNQQIRNLEAQREEEQGIAEEKVEGAKEAQTESEKQLELFQAQIKAQNDQIKLVADEAKQIDQLQKQLDKLREKELSVLDRQIKFISLIQQEVADSQKAAKAKLVLETETSSEYEKQKATIDLQQIALARLNREAEATKLGFDPSELKQYRDLLFSLEDLGIKGGKDGGLEGDFAINPEDLPDLEALQRESERVLESVKGKVADIKAEFLAFLNEINERLPEFLQFFGEEDAKPPIIDTLKRIAVAVLLVGAAFKTVDLAYKLIIIAGAVKTASAAFGTFASALGITGLLSTVAGAIAGLAIPIALVLTTLTLFTIAWNYNWLNMRESVFRFAIGIKEDILSIVPFLTTLKDTIVDTFRKPFSTEGREQIRQEWASLREIFANKEDQARLEEEIKKEFGDISENIRAGIATTGNPFTGALLGGFRETRDAILGDPIAKDIGTVTVDQIALGLTEGDDPFSTYLATALSAFTDIQAQGDFLAAGKTIGSDFASGVPVGIQEQITASEEEVVAYVDALYAQMIAETESQSPSERSKREVGIPIAEGIAEGIGSVDQTEAVKGAIDTILEQFDDLKTKGAAKFDSLRNILVAKQTLLQASLVRVTKQTNSDILGGFQELANDTNEEFTVLFTDILDGWTQLGEDSLFQVEESTRFILAEFQSLAADLFEGESGLTNLKARVVGLFTTMKTEVNTEATGVRDIIEGIFVTNDDSIVKTITRALFGGTDANGETTTSPVYNIGANIMSGIAAGVTNNTITLSNALKASVGAAFNEVGDFLLTGSPSILAARELGVPVSQGIALGILSGADAISESLFSVMQNAVGSSIGGFGASNLSTATPSYVSNVNRTTNYNLNVNSNVQSQGLISDFAILQSMAV